MDMKHILQLLILDKAVRFWANNCIFDEFVIILDENGERRATESFDFIIYYYYYYYDIIILIFWFDWISAIVNFYLSNKI